MINLIKSELYKLKKSKSFRVAAILTVLFAWLIEILDIVMNDIILAEVLDETGRNEYYGTIDIMRQLFANTNAILFVTIFICIYASGDYVGGAVKNYVGKGYSREAVYLARFLVTQFGAVCLYLLTAAAAFAGGLVCYGTKQLGGDFYRNFFGYLGIQIFYLTAYTAIIVWVSEMARNIGICAMVTILGVMLFTQVLIQGADAVLQMVGIAFSLSGYWIMTIISHCPPTDISAELVVSSGMITVIWLLLATVAGTLHFAHRDVA